MMQNILVTVIRSAFTYFFVLVLTRLMGRKLISEMTFFDFIVAVSVGSLAANLGMGVDKSPPSVIAVLMVFTILVLITDFLDIKSLLFRRIIDSRPVVIISNGQIIDENMKKTHLTLNELLMLLREESVFNVADVEFAVFETNGKLSVLLKPEKRPLTPSDMNIKVKKTGIPKDVVIDGVILKDSLKDLKLSESWLLEELKGYGVKDINDVFYAGADPSKNLYVSKRNRNNDSEV